MDRSTIRPSDARFSTGEIASARWTCSAPAVIGLMTAVTLAEAGHDVLVRTAEEPHDTTSTAAGGLALASARAYAETGVYYLSVGALTHSVRALDLGLDLRVSAGARRCR